MVPKMTNQNMGKLCRNKPHAGGWTLLYIAGFGSNPDFLFAFSTHWYCRTGAGIGDGFCKARMYRSAPRRAAADLCLSFTSAGMSRRDSLPVASENKSDQFGSNLGQLHLLWQFGCKVRVLLSPRKDMFYGGHNCLQRGWEVGPFQPDVLLQRG